MSVSLGLDIGGANIKLADGDTFAKSIPFALWKDPNALEPLLRRIAEEHADQQRIAVTMTGELCDCFETKQEGVLHILGAVEAAFPRREILIWSTTGKFLTSSEARLDFLDVAAGNWHALATFAGRFAPQGGALLLDTGSTTTDIIPLWEGEPCSQGKTDEGRLTSGELLYSGVRRTPLCALMDSHATAEFFANTEDVYVRLGKLPERPDASDTADGRAMTMKNAHSRIARMIGSDGSLLSWERSYEIALDVFARQRKLIVDRMAQIASRLPKNPQIVILSGSGEFLAQAAWIDFAVELFQGEQITPVSLAENCGAGISEAACAHAVAVLAGER